MLKVCSVIVCYNPDINALSTLCERLTYNNSAIIIVDNTEKSYISGHMNYPGCTIIVLNENTGIAHAQNIGIKNAIKNGADAVVFFDQDSKVENDYLPLLLAPLRAGEPKVVVPVLFDNVQGYEFPSMRLNKFGFPVNIYRGNRSLPYDVDVITSSGSAATAVTFDIAGPMDEDFFIDFVDTEWSLRCRKRNIPIQVVPTAIMKHTIGEKSINFGFTRGFIHGSARCYYQIRNCFLLFKKENIPFLLAFKEMLSAFVHHLILLGLVKNKAKYIKSYFLAILHGVGGVVGKKQE